MTPPPTWNAQQRLFQQADPDVQEDAPDETGLAAGRDQTMVSLVDSEGKTLFEGTSDQFEEAAKLVPALATAREAAGGTHQRKKRGQRGGVVQIDVAAEPAEPAPEVGFVN
jgi:hypothetical protein